MSSKANMQASFFMVISFRGVGLPAFFTYTTESVILVSKTLLLFRSVRGSALYSSTSTSGVTRSQPYYYFQV